MADSLSTQLSAGQSQDLGRTFFNDLVSRLNAADRPSPVEVDLSTSDVLVHPDSSAGHPLVPDGAVLRDQTDWGGMTDERVLLEWELTGGPGHLDDNGPTSSLETGPGSSVTWTWPESSGDSYYDNRELRGWDATPGGQALPDAAEVQVTGKVLTEPVHGPSVATSSDLASIPSSEASDGDQRLVRDTRTVYKLDTSASSGDVQWSNGSGYWIQQSGTFYTTVGSTTKEFQVRRAYDPDSVPGTVIQLRTSQELAYLDGDGTAGIILYDDSTFLDSATEVTREITGKFEGQSEGDGVSISGSYIDNNEDILGASNSDWREVDVTAQAVGTLTITADYDVVGGQNHTTKKRIEVVPSPDPSMEATLDPKAPKSELVPQRGRPQVKLGEEVKLTQVTKTGDFFEGTFDLKWSDERAAEVARRLDLDDLQVDETITDDPVDVEREQLELLNRAGTLLNAAIGQSTSHGLATYELTFEGTPSLESGQVVRASGATFRIQEVGDPHVAVGLKPTGWSAPEKGRITGAGRWFVVDMEAGYGTPGESSFPQRELQSTELIDPVVGDNQAGITLPKEEPSRATDGWHLKYRVTARWENGATTTTGWTSWQDAEPVPSGSPSISLTEKADGQYEATLGENADTFHGVAGWRGTENVPTGKPEGDTRAVGAGPVPEYILTEPPVTNPHGSVFFLEGHYRTEAGTCQPQVQRALSREVSGGGLPFIETDNDNPPQAVEVPSNDGVILKGPSRRWISVDGNWAPVGAGADRIGVTSAQVLQGGSVYPATQTSATRWEDSSISFPGSGEITVRFIVEGGVGSAELVEAPAGTVSYDEENSTVDVSFSMQPQFHDSTLNFTVRLVPSGTAAEEKMVQMVLIDKNTTAGKPKIARVDASAKDGSDLCGSSSCISYDQNNLTYTIDHDGLSDMTMNLFLKNVKSVSNVKRVGSKTKFNKIEYLGWQPPYINLSTNDLQPASGQSNVSFEADLESADGTTKTYTIKLNDTTS